MPEVVRKNEELIGAAPIEVIREVVKCNLRISGLNFWFYDYVPLKHDEVGRNPIWLTRDQILQDGAVEEVEKDIQENEQIATSSRVKLVSGEMAHLPMMDFEIRRGEKGLMKVTERLKYVGIKNGWLLETGKSYHFYGQDILTQEQWLDFMGLCLLTSIVHTREDIEQVADPRYIGHSLRRGCNTLRVTSRLDKDFIPRVVAKV